MGCDGGSIVKRSELVKTKKKEESVDSSEITKSLWTCCFISKEPLETPIVACRLGRLYNKESVIQYLLDRRGGGGGDETLEKELSHVKSLKDIFTVKLKKPTMSSEWFSCPVTGREMNGSGKFFAYPICGCVLSEQALREFPNPKSCLVCSKSFEETTSLTPEIIQLNPKVEEIEGLRMKLMQNKKITKKERKHEGEGGMEGRIIRDDKSKQIYEEIRESSGEIQALKVTKVTESLYKTEGDKDAPKTSAESFSCRTFNRYCS